MVLSRVWCSGAYDAKMVKIYSGHSRYCYLDEWVPSVSTVVFKNVWLAVICFYGEKDLL